MFLINDIVNEIQKIIETNTRGHANEKETVFHVYKCVAKVLALLLESDNEQHGLETQNSDDEQPDTTDMAGLESEESAPQRRNLKGKGLKILTPIQILSRLPISLAQLEAGNNSKTLKNKIRKPLYSLYRSKKFNQNNL